jgi:integrase
LSGGGFAKKRDAQRALADVITRQSKGLLAQDSRQSVGDHMDEWLTAIRSTVRPKTWHSYGQLVRLHILPTLGSIPLRELRPMDLNLLYDRLLRHGGQKGKGLSTGTVRYVHAVIHRALRDAVRWEKIMRNVADLADPPRLTTPEMKTWTGEQVRTFLDSVSDDRLQAAWLLMCTTGVRKGELLGLRWKDVDLEGARLAVRQTLTSIGYGTEFAEPKTRRSRRQIALDRRTVAALREHRTRQNAERRAWGPAWTDTGLVFTREDGLPIHPDQFQQVFERLVRKAGVPRINLHGLRHTHATLALKAGVHPKIVSERLGHSSVAFTMDVYAHVVEGMQEQAADAIVALIFPRPGHE